MGQKQKTKKYAKILGETKSQPREFPRSGSKAEDVKEREKERPKVGNKNDQLCIATPPLVADEAKLAIVFTYFLLLSFGSCDRCGPL